MRDRLFTPTFGSAGYGSSERKQSYDDSFVEYVEHEKAKEMVSKQIQRKSESQKGIKEREENKKIHLIPRFRSPVPNFNEDRKRITSFKFTPSSHHGSESSPDGRFSRFLRTPDMVFPRMPSLSALQRRPQGLQFMFVDQAEAYGSLEVIAQKLDFGEDWDDKQSEFQIMDKVESQRLSAAVSSVEEVDLASLDYSMHPEQLLELIMPRVFIQSVVALQNLRIFDAERKVDFLERNLKSDLEMNSKTQALKIQLILAQERNNNSNKVVQDTLRMMLIKMDKIKALFGICSSPKLLHSKSQDVVYKDAFRAEVELNIEKYGGTITIKHIYAYVQFSVQNKLIQFERNPILSTQKDNIIQLVKRIGINALKENGVREFRLGFFLGIKPLYDILTDIALISTQQLISHFFVDQNFIHVGFEVFPLHRQFSASISAVIGVSSKNKYTIELESVKIETMFNTQFVKLEQKTFQVRKDSIKKQVMMPWRQKDEDWKRHNVKVVLSGYYNDIKKQWAQIKKLPSYHALLDLMIATEEIFYYED